MRVTCLLIQSIKWTTMLVGRTFEYWNLYQRVITPCPSLL
nr:MAG TPA: hypothetical protein [Caudoviricetes sp.]